MDAARIRQFADKIRRRSKTDRELRVEEFARKLGKLSRIPDILNRQESVYAAAVTYCFSVAIDLSNSGSLPELRKIISTGETQYMPGYPPMSPVTDSMFCCGVFLTRRFGQTNETAGEIVLQIVRTWRAAPECIHILTRLLSSRLAIVETVAVDGNCAVVRELVSNREFRLKSSTGYISHVGQLRLSRIVVPMDSEVDTFCELTTPYILTDCSAEKWTRYLLDNLPEVAERRDPLCGPDPEQPVLPHSEIADRLAALFENDCGRMKWNDFIMDGYAGFQKQAIFLSGNPGDPESLPHNDSRLSGLDGNDEYEDDDEDELYDFDGNDETDDSDLSNSRCDDFYQSPESESVDSDVSYLPLLWDYADDYFEVEPKELSVEELSEILFRLIPRKVTMEPEEAEDLINEFRAYFLFLERSHGVRRAGKLAALCDSNAAEKLRKKLGESSNFGLAKSFIMAGQQAGFDMTSQAESALFAQLFNSRLQDLSQHTGNMEVAERTDEDFDADSRPVTTIRKETSIGRNDPCPCGSGKKYKKCCLNHT